MIYIRHAEKSYKNGDSAEFSLEPDLTENGREQAKIRFRSLLENYGRPTRIISSPYLRARETAKIAQDVILEVTGKYVEISYDPTIGEYLDHQNNISLEQGLRPETLALNPIPHETLTQYRSRVRQHTRRRSKNGWYISHGMVIQSVAHFNDTKIPYPPPLSAIHIDSDVVIVI